MHNFSAPTPIADLWRTARAWFTDALASLGGPQTIRQTLDRVARRAIRRQLKALETLVMKLLLIEAAKLAPLPMRHARTAPSGQGRTAHDADPAQPETWRVCYQIHIPPEPETTTAPHIRSLGPSPFIRAIVLDAKTLQQKLAHMAAMRAANASEARAHANAEKLARRFEALRRVFANPLPRARRLKRKLLALKQRAFAAAKRIALSKPTPRQGDAIFEDRAQYAARHVMAAFAFDSG